MAPEEPIQGFAGASCALSVSHVCAKAKSSHLPGKTTRHPRSAVGGGAPAADAGAPLVVIPKKFDQLGQMELDADLRC